MKKNRDRSGVQQLNWFWRVLERPNTSTTVSDTLFCFVSLLWRPDTFENGDCFENSPPAGAFKDTPTSGFGELVGEQVLYKKKNKQTIFWQQPSYQNLFHPSEIQSQMSECPWMQRWPKNPPEQTQTNVDKIISTWDIHACFSYGWQNQQIVLMLKSKHFTTASILLLAAWLGLSIIQSDALNLGDGAQFMCNLFIFLPSVCLLIFPPHWTKLSKREGRLVKI